MSVVAALARGAAAGAAQTRSVAGALQGAAFGAASALSPVVGAGLLAFSALQRIGVVKRGHWPAPGTIQPLLAYMTDALVVEGLMLARREGIGYQDAATIMLRVARDAAGPRAPPPPTCRTETRTGRPFQVCFGVELARDELAPFYAALRAAERIAA